MSTFKAYMKKEIIESIRLYRYIILAAGIIAFAILDPFMLKILPMILEKQMAGSLSSLIIATPKSAVINYINDLTQIGNLVIIFTLSGIVCDEIKSQKLVFPYSKGSSAAGIILAKTIHYTITVSLFILIGFLTVFYYSNILFDGEGVELLGILKSAILMSVYSFFNITLVILLSSFLNKGISVGFLVIILDVITGFFVSVDGIGKLMPYQLIGAANQFSFNNAILTISFIILVGVACTALTIYRLNRVELI